MWKAEALSLLFVPPAKGGGMEIYMLKFLKKILLFFLLLLIEIAGITAFSYFVIGSQYQYNYQASLIDKVERLTSIDEPKIILVGHSNLSFGIKSEMLEEALGMPVVNLGLHGGLGNAYHEQIAKLGINKDDIVVICYSSFSDDGTISDTELAWITYDYNNALFPIVQSKDYLSMLKSYPTYLRKSILLWLTHGGNQIPEDCYSRKAFNKYGDVAYKPEAGQMDVDAFFSQDMISVPQINDICIDRLNELNQYCIDQGAAMVIAGYPIAYGKYADFSENDFSELKSNLEDVLDCDVISDYTDYFYPYQYFYNTNLHLTDKGAGIRTKQLINDIKKWMDGQ